VFASQTSSPAMLIKPLSMDRGVLQHSMAIGHYQGLHVSASASKPITRFARELGKPAFIDPQTYVFRLDPTKQVDKKTGRIRLWIRRLSEEYGAVTKALAGTRALSPDVLLRNEVGRREFIRLVMQYQRQRLFGQSSLLNAYYEEYAAYAVAEGETAVAANITDSPSVLIPPYFYFSAPGDDWYRLVLGCAREALTERQFGEQVFVVLHFRAGLLAEEDSVTRLAGDLEDAGFDGYLIWPNDFREYKAKLKTCGGLIRLIGLLSRGGKPVVKMYGGGLSLLLHSQGLQAFSCGLGHGASKNSFALGGGGKMSPMYYMPRLHRALSLADAERVLKTSPDLRCDCRVCRSTFDDDMEGFSEMDSYERCGRHFLNVRKRELRTIVNDGVPGLLRKADHTARQYKDNELVDASYLTTWKQALEEYGR